MALPLSKTSVAVLLSVVAACGSNEDDAQRARPDAGSVPADAPNPVDAGEETPSPDAGPGPIGTRLFAEDGLSLVGITADGFVIARAGGSSSKPSRLYAVPIGGGTAQPISEVSDASSPVQIEGSTVLVWPASAAKFSTGETTDLGALEVWTAAQGKKTLAARAPFIAARVLGQKVVFWKRHAETGNASDLAIADIDGSHATTLVSEATPCSGKPELSGTRILVGICDSSAGLVPTAALASFDAANGYARTDLIEGTVEWKSGQGRVIALDTAKTLRVVAASGGPPEVIADGVEQAEIVGDSVVFVTTNHAIERAPLSGGAPSVVATGVQRIHAAAPDEQRVLTSIRDGAKESFGLALLAPPGAFVSLGDEPRDWPTPKWREPFTADSRHALFVTSMGELVAYATADGARRLVDGKTRRYTALDRSRVLFESGLTIRVVDLATAAPSTQVADWAWDHAVTSDAERLVYVWRKYPEKSALYMTPIPR